MPNEVAISQQLSIRDAGLDEYRLQDQIVENPACLGLGELDVLAKSVPCVTGIAVSHSLHVTAWASQASPTISVVIAPQFGHSAISSATARSVCISRKKVASAISRFASGWEYRRGRTHATPALPQLKTRTACIAASR